MSSAPAMAALLRGVRTQLQTTLAKNGNWIDIDPEGRPGPNMPYWKASIGPGSIQRVEANEEYIVRTLGITINIVKQLGVVPRDRRNWTYLDEVQSLEVLAEQVIGITMSRNAINTANSWLNSFEFVTDTSGNQLTDTSGSPLTTSGTVTVNGFIKPLVFASATEPTIEDGSYVRELNTDKRSFFVQSLRFDGAVIVQKVANLIEAATPA
jgi:hypothetical protein